MLIGLLDRIIFTCGVIIFLQLPAFIDQYTHRLGGYYRSQLSQIADFQTIADKNYAGDLSLLIRDFSASDKSSIKDTGKNIQSSIYLAKAIKTELKTLENGSLTQKIMFMISHLRYELANDTLKQFNPSFPLNIQSLLYGLIGGILASGLFNLIVRLPMRLISKRKHDMKLIH